MKMIKAAFFDRDGTLIDDVPYLSNLAELSVIPRAVQIARILQNQGYTLFVITNQSGIARGFFDVQFVHTTHNYLGQLLALQQVHIEQFYFCPHHPTQATVERYAQDCLCRKPKPGLLQKAAQEYNIDLAASLMLGNEERDLHAGRAAGCKTLDITALFTLSLEECVRLLIEICKSDSSPSTSLGRVDCCQGVGYGT